MIAEIMWEIPSWKTITLYEIIWILSGLIAITFTSLHLRPLYLDWNIARNSNRPALTAAAAGYLRREILRFGQGACILVIGVYAAAKAPALPGPVILSPVALVLTIVLVTLSLLVSIQSILDWRTRHIIQELILEGKNGH